MDQIKSKKKPNHEQNQVHPQRRKNKQINEDMK